MAINDKSWIVGAVALPTARGSTPVIWHDGVTNSIPLPANAASGTAIAINNAGQVLVNYSGFDDYVMANGTLWQNDFLIWDNGIETALPKFLDPVFMTDAFAMNNSGTVVGTSANHAVVWQNGQIYDLDNLIPADSGWTLTSATGINDAGDIVGYGTFDGLEAPLPPYPHPRPLLLSPRPRTHHPLPPPHRRPPPPPPPPPANPPENPESLEFL